MTIKRAYGCIRATPPETAPHIITLGAPAPLPPKTDISPLFKTPVFDQAQSNACTGNAIAEAVEFARIKKGLKDYHVSRLFIYWIERYMEGTINQDAGAIISDGIKAIETYGAPPETDWPFDTNKLFIEPPRYAFKDALANLVRTALAVVQSEIEMKTCLAEGYPFVFGSTIYEAFESTAVEATGMVPMPDKTKDKIVGGHALLAVGYDDSTRLFKVRNSWGPYWGDKGYCYMPYDYLTDPHLTSDIWTVRNFYPNGSNRKVVVPVAG